MPNIAVVGTGYWGKNLVRNFAELGALHTICDTDIRTLKSFASQWSHLHLTANFSEVLQNPEIDAVAIAAPAVLHHALSKAALEAGKNVFVEKPLALTATEGEELTALSHQRDRILMVGHLLEYHPAVIALKNLVDDGVLGKVQYIYSNRLNLGKIRKEENILWSFAPHDLSVILSLLNEMPSHAASHGATYFHQGVTDVTISTLDFPSGVKAHIFVSWLHPYKEQKLIVVGDKQMACFDDTVSDGKLKLFSHNIQWIERVPVVQKAQAESVVIADIEPLRAECQHFISCIEQHTAPRTDGANGVRVLRVLQACQQSLEEAGAVVPLANPTSSSPASTSVSQPYHAHPTSTLDDSCSIGCGTHILPYVHIMHEAQIGESCNIGQNVLVGSGVTIGNRVKLENNVSLCAGVRLEDEVFCGPSVVFTNVMYPLSDGHSHQELQPTIVHKGATLGANATILCGVTIGKYAFIGAGAMVFKDVPDYGLILGNPGQLHGWACRCKTQLYLTAGQSICSACHRVYSLRGGQLIPIEEDNYISIQHVAAETF
jgi:UDP-2-acetamido-3-amino-2,3-dideoxy-glucuronate N-acetyltransferase